MSRSILAAGVRPLRGLLAAQRHSEDSDEQLLHAFTDGHDDSAFAALVRRHGPMVMGVCRRVLGHQQDAEDALQATFLVLARNAATLRDKTALASFLHGTAYRMALTAKRASIRRRKHERQMPARSTDSPADELLWREVRTLLDEEIARLPEIYRSVFVLCCLENLSHTEAARRLGLKEVTVSSRLAGARKRLQRRLSRRGMDLMALLAATALTTETASALLPVLMAKTSQAALSPAVAALVDSCPTILGVGKIKLAAVFVLAASVLTGAGLWAYRSPAAPPAQPPKSSAWQSKPAPTPAKPATVMLRGRVLDPDGKPVKGARLYWPRVPKTMPLSEEDLEIPERGRTDAEGRFQFELPSSDMRPQWKLALVAGYDSFRYERLMRSTDTEGRFRLTVIPGPGVLMTQVRGREKANGGQQMNPYKLAEFDAKDREHIKVTDRGDGDAYFTAADNTLTFLHLENAVKWLDLATDAGTVKCDLVVDRGQTRTVKIEDAKGKPLTGTMVAGVTASWPIVFSIPESAFTVFALDPKKPRRLVFFHAERKLAGTLTVRGDEKEPLTVRLVLAGTVMGRLLDADGQPIAGVDIDLSPPDSTARELYRQLDQRRAAIRTDKDGRFRLEGVVPNLKFGLGLRQGRNYLIGEPRIGLKQVEPGKTLDLGDVRVKPQQ